MYFVVGTFHAQNVQTFPTLLDQDTVGIAGRNLCAIQKNSTASVGVQFKGIPPEVSYDHGEWGTVNPNKNQ